MTVDSVASGARLVPLTEVVDLNPRPERGALSEDLEVSFVPMAAVEAGTGRMDSSKVRPFGVVKKGYTIFREGDVLFAKITPCMENGKMAVARGLRNGVGCGSTEFHVLRPKLGVDPHYVYHFVSSARFRAEAAHHMTGAVGQKRVPAAFLEHSEIPLPDPDEQRRIVAEIEKQFSRLDEAGANLKRAKANLKHYKAAVLQAAVEGRLVPLEADLARREGRSYEAGAQLLQRILESRRKRWKGKGKYREPSTINPEHLPGLPEGWAWGSWDQVGFSQNGRAFPSSDYSDIGIRLLRPGNLHESGSIVWTIENTRSMPSRYAVENADLVIQGNELVMNLTAQSLKDEFLGRVCLTSDGERCLLNQRLARLTPIEIPPRFAVIVFKSKWFRRFVDGLNTGSLIQHMFTSQLVTFAIPIPPIAEQHRIIAEVDRHLCFVREVEDILDASDMRGQTLRRAFLNRSLSVPA